MRHPFWRRDARACGRLCLAAADSAAEVGGGGELGVWMYGGNRCGRRLAIGSSYENQRGACLPRHQRMQAKPKAKRTLERDGGERETHAPRVRPDKRDRGSRTRHVRRTSATCPVSGDRTRTSARPRTTASANPSVSNTCAPHTHMARRLQCRASWNGPAMKITQLKRLDSRRLIERRAVQPRLRTVL